jgi:hypothetical protein
MLHSLKSWQIFSLEIGNLPIMPFFLSCDDTI